MYPLSNETDFFRILAILQLITVSDFGSFPISIPTGMALRFSLE